MRPHPLFERRRDPETAWQATQRKVFLALFCVVAAGGYYSAFQNFKSGGLLGGQSVAEDTVTPSDAGTPPQKTFPSLVAPARRDDLPYLLEKEGLRIGAELGVQRGGFAQHTLQQWSSCEQYLVIDTQFDNSVGSEQQARHEQLKEALAPWKDKAALLKMSIQEVAAQIPNNALDYIYVGSRHDYCGMLEDLELLWPKLKRGGILAGWDYLTAADALELAPAEDWGLCQDGTKNEGAVKGAVDDFARKHELTVTVTYRERDWPSFVARKP